MQEENQDVQVADTEKATDEGNLTQNDLLKYLSSEPPSEEAEESAEPAEEVAEPDDVLSQSEEEGEQPEEDAEEEIEEEEEEETQPKSVQKLLKQVGRLTARSKSAEEKVEQLSAQLDSMRLDKKVEDNPSIGEVQSFEDLEKLKKEALSAKKWARANEDESYVTEGDKEYTRQDIKKIRDSAEEHLEELIPEREKFLRLKQNSEAQAQEDFSFFKDESSREMEILANMSADENLKVLDKLPNGLYLKSLLVEGILVVEQRKKGPAKIKKAKVTPKPLSAPTSDASPPVRSQTTNSDRRKKILGDSNISESQLSAFLS